jgi:hypothetical protein
VRWRPRRASHPVRRWSVLLSNVRADCAPRRNGTTRPRGCAVGRPNVGPRPAPPIGRRVPRPLGRLGLLGAGSPPTATTSAWLESARSWPIADSFSAPMPPSSSRMVSRCSRRSTPRTGPCCSQRRTRCSSNESELTSVGRSTTPRTGLDGGEYRDEHGDDRLRPLV